MFLRTKMIDIGAKDIVKRSAKARGEILLKRDTVDLIQKGKIEKGDVLATAEVGGIMAVKKTSEIIPLCHPIPLTSVSFDYEVGEDRIICYCQVQADYKTGVEMEAIAGVTIALLTIWDMVKYLEKDEDGQYPSTRITNIEILEKVKG
ncbi:MAG: cyclic pyranopterin monophosphate synthase MoaC [Methanocellales archaeon]|nr:cyclic pyranopterin monophosphate synthase MoaC [Methanocellales archaeon]